MKKEHALPNSASLPGTEQAVAPQEGAQQTEPVFRAVVEAGDYFTRVIEKGQRIRIVDLEGNQAVDTLFYNAHDTADRYSAQDTIREQGNIYLTTGTKLLSTGGNVLLTIVDDTCGRHDTLGGACAQESNQVRYAIEKKPMHACRQSFLRGALAWAESAGIEFRKQDIAANINFFMNVPVTPEGGLTFEDGVSEAGKYVELRAEMDVLMLISNCPQLNNPCNAYNPTPVEVVVWTE
jgi:urea carboxylase-associated protein 1